jgi:8-oxo-dGTP pyrophosphatase MutT (NUDIX family)
MRLGYRVAYRGLQAWTFVRRPQVRGTMIAVWDGSPGPSGALGARRVLLVRHTYGDRRRWELPGGWVQRGEDPAVAARREVLEEIGIDVELRPREVLEGDWDFKHESLTWFEAEWPGGRGTYDPVEIAEVAWFALDALPDRLGEAARVVLSRVS